MVLAHIYKFFDHFSCEKVEEPIFSPFECVLALVTSFSQSEAVWISVWTHPWNSDTMLLRSQVATPGGHMEVF